jgi:uncharacterized repeat protein (TIGR03803 family)
MATSSACLPANLSAFPTRLLRRTDRTGGCSPRPRKCARFCSPGAGCISLISVKEPKIVATSMLQKKRILKMQTLRRTVINSGTLLTALIAFTAYAEAKDLYSFQGSSTGPSVDGANPVSTLVIGANGVLYGTTQDGGSAGAGTVFSLTPPVSSGDRWTEAVLYDFQTDHTGKGDGTYPPGGVVIGSGGVLYGTTIYGGNDSFCGGLGCGIVYSLTPPASPGDPWTETVLHVFSGTDGAYPYGGVVIGNGGVLYGTTEFGGGGGGCSDQGAKGCGTVFSLTPPASPGDPWTETVLHAFTDALSGRIDGAAPLTNIVIGKGGVLFGTTFNGGTAASPCTDQSGCGTVFRLTPPRTGETHWSETVLYSFTGAADGYYPWGLVMGGTDVLYGMTFTAVFSLAPPASTGLPWSISVLAPTPGGTPFPTSHLAIGKGDVLYGTSFHGGTGPCGCGTVFSVAPPASPGSPWTETVVHNFAESDGAFPWAGVVISKSGVLYGTTWEGGTGGCVDSDGNTGCGTVFALEP